MKVLFIYYFPHTVIILIALFLLIKIMLLLFYQMKFAAFFDFIYIPKNHALYNYSVKRRKIRRLQNLCSIIILILFAFLFTHYYYN
ncbi:MAG: hypothetical protein JWQ09_4930 [Segetibacter sp.]|nr:hypothetical protein [Segetibacter sp.]